MESYRTGGRITISDVEAVHDTWAVFPEAAMTQEFGSMHPCAMKLPSGVVEFRLLIPVSATE
ncbi:hypothetical protein [Arthrobacter pityocampae]|uniref:hypothetical protein n=1 Tax=Arthrobacter pityocampae TaxID=547334 RepID=UPI003736C94F